MSSTLRVLGLSGSLRRVSSNTAALEAAQRLAPATMTLTLYRGLADLPLFNPDDDVEPLPLGVQALMESVRGSDALLVACPEYAHGVPGAFKNLLDWLVSSLDFPGKPVLLLNTSGRGSHHAQDALAEILSTMSARLLTATPLTVALPGAGCTAAQILASEERCLELRMALNCLGAALSSCERFAD